MTRLALLLLLTLAAANAPASADTLNLPMRETPIPQTTDGVPHIQLDVEPNPALSNELLRQVSEIQGVEIHPTIVSLPGALGFWIAEDIEVARPDVIVRGREFAHIHPDGSLHASLSPELAAKAIDAGWAVAHPWSTQRPGWEGFVMIFTPTSETELEVVVDLVKASFEFTSGLAATTL